MRLQEIKGVSERCADLPSDAGVWRQRQDSRRGDVAVCKVEAIVGDRRDNRRKWRAESKAG